MESPLNSEEKFGLFPLAALAVIFVIAAPVFWQEVELRPSTVTYSPENEDLHRFYTPVYRQAYEALRGGRIPLWDATRLCGTTLIGDPRVGIFQPMNLVFLLAPFPEGFAVHAFTCLAAAGIAFVLFGRSMGVGFIAALFGGLCFAFSGAAAGAMSRPPLAAAMVWIPMVMWSTREHADHPRAASIVFMGLALAGLLLSGALAVFAATASLATVYILLVSATASRKNSVSMFGALGGYVAAIALSGCIAAVQLLPVLWTAIHLDDPATLVQTVIPAGTLPGGLREAAAQIVAPEPASLPVLIHIGIIGLIVLPAALLQRRRLTEVLLYLIAAVGLILVGVLFAPKFPRALPPYAIVYPAMGYLAAGCALGADRIMRKRTGPGREWYWLSVGLVLCACVGVFVVGSTLTRGYATVAAGVVIVLLMARANAIRVVLGLVLCGLAWTNLVTSSRNVFGHPFSANASDQVLVDHETISGLEGSRSVMVGDLRDGFGPLNNALRRADGFGGLFTREEAAWWRALSATDSPSGTIDHIPDLALLGAMGGRTIFAGQDLDASETNISWVTAGGGYQYATNNAAIPRAHWVTQVEWVDTIDDAIASIREHDVGVASVAFVDSRYRTLDEVAGISDAEASMNATASVEDRSPEHVVVTLRTPTRGVLVLSDSYSQDWQAEVDGAPATIMRVNGLFRGLVIPEGDHVVEFRYRPWAFYAGGIVSIATLALLALWGVIRLFR